jgi:acyl-CoA synthetase (AMP-forming)/AMP-acid ligase II
MRHPQGKALALDELNSWARQRMALYKLPRRLLLVKEIPRNAMGKVNKKDLRKYFGPNAPQL